MVEPHGAQINEPQYLPRQEVRTSPSAGPSIGLILAAGVLIPGAITYALATYEAAAAVALFMAALAGLLVMARPFVGLIAFLILVYCRPEEIVPEITGARLTLIVIVLTLFATWMHIFLRRQTLTKTPVVGFMIGLAILAPLSTIIKGGDTYNAVRVTLMLALLVLLILNLIRTRASYQAFVTGLIAVTTYLAGYSIYLSQMGIGYMQKDGEDRFIRVLTEGSIFSDPNDLASALVPGLALVLTRLIQAPGWRKAPYVLISGLLIYSTFMTQSRGGLIALIFMLGAFVIMTNKRKMLALGIAAVLGLGVIVVASDRMTTINADEASAQSRMQYWQNGLEAIPTSPLIGVGYSRYNELNYNNQAPHNTFMELLVELGVFAFFCFMGVFYYAFRKPTEAAREANAKLTDKDRLDLLGTRISLASFMVAAFFLSRAYIPVLYIQCCLPLVQQISASGNPNVLRVTSRERFRDWFGILGWCIVAVAIVKIMVWRFL